MKNSSIKKKILLVILAVFAILFVFLPFSGTDVFLRITLDENYPVNPDTFFLYYNNGSGYSNDCVITATYNAEKGIVTFRIPDELGGRVSGLRIDFPNTEQVIGVKDVTLSSAGIIQKRYHPCFFFAPENVEAQNGLTAIDQVQVRARTYIGATSDDPYVVLAGPLSAEILHSASDYRLTRFLIVLFIAGCMITYHKKLFQEVAA